MKKSGKQLFSLLLSCTMLAGTVSMPVSAVSDAAPAPAAADNEETAQTAAVQNTAGAADTAAEATVSDYAKSEPISFTVEGSSTVYTINANDIQLEVTAPVLASDDTVEIDTSSPIILTVESELNDIKVLNDDGESVELTDEQVQTILYLYGQYVDNWEENADVLGVQLPFFYSYNDSEDSLGIIGEMLVLAGKTVDDVRKGDYTYDDVVGMLQVFMYGNALGSSLYRDAIAAKRDDAMKAIEASGAQTYAQKLLVLNNWIAQNVEFDMAYLMNSGDDGSEKMKAPNPQQHQYYDTVYNVIYGDMESAITQQFKDKIRAGVIAQFRQQYYEGAIKESYRQGAYDRIYASEYEKAYNSEFETAYAAEKKKALEEALETEEQKVWDEAYAAKKASYPSESDGKLVYQDAYDAAIDEFAATEKGKAIYDEAYMKALQSYKAAETDEKSIYETEYDKALDAYLTQYKKDNADEYNALLDKYRELFYQNNGTAKPEEAEEYAQEHADAEIITSDEAKEYAETEAFKAVEANESAVAYAESEAKKAVEDSSEADEYATEKANDAVDKKADEAAKAAADQAVKDEAEQIQSAAEADVAAKDEEIKAAADETAKPKAEGTAKAIAEEQAKVAANQFMEDNADAISEDAPGFVEATFGAEAAEQIAAGCDTFIENAESEGVELDPENAPGKKTTIDEIVEQQMNQPLNDLGGMTPNEAVPVYATQAAEGMAPAVIDGWKGSHIGALGDGVGVCVGYAKAFAYLVQFMSPEQYGVNGSGTDMTAAKNWKTSDDLYYNEDGSININAGYNVDLVRITYNANVSMFGQDSVFGEVHFWNAVKVDGVWYYIDPCYIDIYTECMDRTRVETNGDINNLYFLVSHSSIEQLYNGYYKEIASLYADVATNTQYEDSWMARIRSSVYSDNEYFYYSYDSEDMISMKTNNSYGESETMYKIVRHMITDDDTSISGDEDYNTLIYFNYYENEDDEESRVAVYGADGTIWPEEDTAWLTELYAEHLDMEQIYPALTLSVGLYDGKVYFNLSNKLLCYDIAADDIYVVKEYNTVSATRDLTVQLGGMAFTITDTETSPYEVKDEDGNTVYTVPTFFTVENHPIAGFTIKRDGKMYIDIATNLSYISGNDDMDLYGYEFEESDYNSAYNSYVNEHNDGSYGYENDTNDNDEFMWSANFREELDMSHLSGESHTYEEVSISAYCEKDAFTEQRCTECGKINPNAARTVEEATAHEHHFLRFEETYYTKDDNENYNTGFCYVCVECGYHMEEPTEPEKNDNYEQAGTSYEEQMAIYEEQKAIYDEIVANAGHLYVPTNAEWSEDGKTVTFSRVECEFECCHNRAETLDLFTDDNTSKNPVSQELSEPITAEAEAVGYEGECSVGITTVYAAEGTFSTNFGSYKYRAENKVTGEAGEHKVQSEFTWTPAVDEEGNPTGGYTAVTATLSCEVCGISYENVEAVVTTERKEPTCTEEGSVTYTAVASVKGEDDHEIISATDTKTEVLEKVPHIYKDGICEVCNEEEPPAFTISGEVTSYTTSDEASPEVMLTLMNEDGTTVLDTIVLTEGETTYSFAVKAGTYTLKVEKENHVTRTYTIIVDTESVEQNVVICPIGDVNLDGRINVRDYNLLFKFIAVSGEGLDDPYARLCADVNGDGSLNVRDYNAIFKHVSSSNKLW